MLDRVIKWLNVGRITDVLIAKRNRVLESHDYLRYKNRVPD